jgi:hypothetical protein
VSEEGRRQQALLDTGGGAPEYSRAFERFVGSPDDIVGLIAYARYKSSIREAVLSGVPTDKAARTPVPSTVGVFRQAAEQLVAEMINAGIEQARPDIEASATRSAVEASQASVLAALTGSTTAMKAHFNERTSFWQSIIVSVVGWLITLGITAIIIFTAGRASIEDKVKGAVSAGAGDPQLAAPARVTKGTAP